MYQQLVKGEKMVKALTLYGPGNLGVSNYEIPDDCEDGIIVDIIACGICGTDGHLIDGKMELNYPIIPGHEFYGKVSYIGKNNHVTSLNGEICIGDIITVLPGKSCGECIYCKSISNAEELCINRKTYGMSFNIKKTPYLGGGYAEKVYLTGNFSVYHIPQDWPLGFGAILETVAVGVHAADRAIEKTTPIDNRKLTAVIIGAGAVGISVALAIINRGIDVSVIEPLDERRKLAKEIGVRNVYKSYDFDKTWLELFVNDLGGMKPDIVIEAAGKLETFEAAVNLTRRGGTVLELGNFVDIGDITVKPSYICRNEITIVGSALAPESSFSEAVDILNSIKDKSELFICPHFTLNEYKKAIDNLKKEKNGLKAVFVTGGAV